MAEKSFIFLDAVIPTKCRQDSSNKGKKENEK